ncbi:MAG: TVP38/TMEM64 family protein, partial [Myxococcota bacterium]
TIKNAVQRHATTLRWLAIALLVAAVLLSVRLLPLAETIMAFTTWVEGLGWVGYGVFIGVYAVATVLFVPGSVLTLAAAPLFGLVRGLFVVWVGATLGASLAFVIARYVASETMAKLKERYPRFAAIDQAVAQEGWKIVALTRLSPAFPFNLQNYLYGLTSVGFVPYVLATWTAMLPGTFMYVYIGYIGAAGLSEASGTSSASIGQWALRLVGLAATVAVTVYVTSIARKALDSTTDSEQTPNADGLQPPNSASL